MFFRMQSAKRFKTNFFLSVCFVFATTLTPTVMAKLTPANPAPQLGNDEGAFTFAGRCPNGDNYRLLSYEAHVNGQLHTFYDYEGPVGKGTVKSAASPKTMSVRVCRKLAEIINSNYWE
jgi:hypothetical protein